jgi:hypothetical protein
MEKPSRELGLAIGLLLLSAPEWLHRKVDTLIFSNAANFRRQVSVDFHVMPQGDATNDTYPGHVLIPLAILKKEVLFGFDLFDEAGDSVPLLTSDENIWIAWSVLTALAETSLEEGEPPLTDDELSALRNVVSASGDEAEEALRCLENHARIATLRTKPLLYAGLATLADNFILVVPIDPETGPRRIVKFSYEVDISHQIADFSFSQRFGLESAALHVELPRLDARSHHVETHAPTGLQISADPFVNPSPDELIEQPSVRVGHTAAISHAHITPGEFILARAPSAELTFSFFPTENGLVRLAAGVGALVFAILSLALLDSAAIVTARNSPETPATLLLTVLGVLTLFIVRPGEHHFVSYLLVPYRLAVTVAGALIPLAAALSLLSDRFTDQEITWFWFALLVASGILEALFGFVYLRARRLWRTREAQ